ncbi:MAG: hypothetical protein KTR31_23620 [Myxococcales bacterium]|nr:hypothetical protein [Myxococcales bacterium]
MRLTLSGLEARPAQVFGAVRWVPLVRAEPLADLRMALRSYEASLAVASVSKRVHYTSYVPHGLVMRWSTDEAAEVPAETRIGRKEVQQHGPVVLLKRMVRREAPDQLRMLPLHFAMEGFLALHFGGPEVAWDCYSRRVLSWGLSPRSERSWQGRQAPGLAEAARLFEVHQGQCGVMLFVGDHLMSVTVVSHPDDYFALHQALVDDFYGDLLLRYGWEHRTVHPVGVQLRGTTLDEIAGSLQQQRAAWQDFATEMAGGLFGREVVAEVVRKVGRYRLVRFATGFDETQVPRDGEHLAEALVDDDDRIAYLKTYRLDRSQVRRAKILTELAAHDWSLKQLADHEGHGIVRRIEVDLERAGLGWILADHRRRR